MIDSAAPSQLALLIAVALLAVGVGYGFHLQVHGVAHGPGTRVNHQITTAP